MSYIALVIIVFAMNGEPTMLTRILPGGANCDAQVALAFAKEGNAQIQDEVLWNCLPFVSPGPARPALYPGLTEALQ